MHPSRICLRAAINTVKRQNRAIQRVCRYTTSDAVEKDAELKKVFDSQPFWANFRSSPKLATSSTGLFDNPLLDSVEGIFQFTDSSLQRAMSLARQIIDASSPEELRSTIRNLDRLSDVLCKVIDMVAFVRMAHPDRSFLEAAQRSHEIMYEYMNVLNTSVELYDKLNYVLHDPGISAALSDVEKVVGRILLEDFKLSGVTLAPEQREKFVQLSNSVSILGQQFATESRPVKDSISFSSKQVFGLDPQLAHHLGNGLGRVRIPTSGPLSSIALRTIADENIRRELWAAQRSASKNQEKILKQFLRDRASLAKMMGRQSFAEYELKEKMAKNPHNVMQFLTDLCDRTYPLAKKELGTLADLKAADPNAVTKELQAWDRDYYSAKALQARRTRGIYAPDTLSSYFSLGNVMQGLSRLFSRIYGIRFVPAETKNGEVWHHDVRRLNVVSDTDGLIGVMYCDLFERDGKSPNPAHYTVQCSMEICPDDPSYESDKTLLDIGGKRYQPPIIVLMCDFNYSDDGLCLLSFSEVETLFHEMGHAIHSMVGRTSLHNVSGTRCATDFVELPSMLMEHFASAPEVLSLYARHHATGEPLPYSLLKSHLDNQATFSHFETYNQIKLSLLDQIYHSEVANADDFSPYRLYHELESTRGLFPDYMKSQWHTYFGHLAGYGATYYCYLFDRAIADKIWKKVFEENPISREAGEKFRTEVLAWGGSRDPWKCVAGVLEEPELEAGGEAAVLGVGRGMTL